jgi:hypothetical protein
MAAESKELKAALTATLAKLKNGAMPVKTGPLREQSWGGFFRHQYLFTLDFVS